MAEVDGVAVAVGNARMLAGRGIDSDEALVAATEAEWSAQGATSNPLAPLLLFFTTRSVFPSIIIPITCCSPDALAPPLIFFTTCPVLPTYNSGSSLSLLLSCPLQAVPINRGKVRLHSSCRYRPPKSVILVGLARSKQEGFTVQIVYIEVTLRGKAFWQSRSFVASDILCTPERLYFKG